MKEEIRLGRFVQCKCSHTCASEDLGFQWLLPKTKSKHMLYEGVLIKNQKEKVEMINELEEGFSSVSLYSKIKDKKIKKQNKKSTKDLKKRWLKEKEQNLLVLKEFTVFCSTRHHSSLVDPFQFNNEYY